ncbi:MAG: gamma carbonic anhydrase family protein [Bacteroidales bacterium]|nr:gamma carbonic anhydrase family protein [Bacteroidales bacterium]
MSLIKTVRGFTPVFGNNCFFAENSTIVGDVKVGNDCSFWFNSVVRGDVNSIRIGNKVNIQDGAILHCTFEKTKIHIGNNVSVGHNVIIHGATIHNNVLVGMGAIIMDNVEIGENSIIAAGAVVLENTLVESGSIYGGIPAKRIKSIEQNQTKEMIEKIANNYLMYAKWYE